MSSASTPRPDGRRVVDLTQPLGEGTVLWPGTGPFRAEVTSEHERDRFYSRDLHTPEHAGTHLDAPAHVAPGGAYAADVPAERLVVECALLDVSDRCTADPDFTMSRGDVEELERRDGPLADGCAVLVRTGWDRFRDDGERYAGRFPGLGPSAAEALIERGAVGIGIDTLGIDPGHTGVEAPVHRITLPAGLWHLEGLVGLGELPARGALLFVGALKLERGSGAPARVMALLPG
jgi:kynurenine formamidase